MIIKTFTAPSLDKALWLLNEDLGSAAVVLKTRFNRTKGNSQKTLKFVEITAAVDSSLLGQENAEYPRANSAALIQSIFNFTKDSSEIKRKSSHKAEIVEVIGW